MKKVLIVCAKLDLGGAERVAFNIGHYRDKYKYECHYIVFGDIVGEFEHQLLEEGCKIFHVPSPASNHIAFIQYLNELIEKERYDIVHSHTMFNSGLVMHVARKNRVPGRITHSHSIRSRVKETPLSMAYNKLMRHFICHDSTEYVACGESAGEWMFGKKRFHDRGVLILNGIDTASYKYNADNARTVRTKYHLEDSFIIGHVGHLNIVKNQQFLVRLMPEIKKRKPTAKLILIGEGSNREMLMQLIRELQLENDVLMTGNIMNVPEFLSAMDVFVFPSLYEGMPLSIIEVQANGLPCILSDTVPKDVFLTDLLKPLSLSETSENWIENICAAKRKNPEQYAALMAETGFDVTNMVKKVYNVYEKY